MENRFDLSTTAAILGDPARANMVMALMSGMALTATELAREAGVTPATASGHLAKLQACGLLDVKRQGRHRYYRIAGPDVADAVEALVSVAARVGHLRTRPGPKDTAMRFARSCYDHLAGRLAVDLHAHWVAARLLAGGDEAVGLTAKGRGFLNERGVDIAALEGKTRPLCRACMDWSERRIHLGGSLGAAVLATALEKGWAHQDSGSRIVRFGPQGEKRFMAWYACESDAAAPGLMPHHKERMAQARAG